MITLFSHETGTNGWKVVIILEALGLKYETKYLAFDKNEHKSSEFTKYNPNGRIPAIIDHDNDNFVVWESNAIIKYLVETYDKDNTIHFPRTERLGETFGKVQIRDREAFERASVTPNTRGEGPGQARNEQ